MKPNDNFNGNLSLGEEDVSLKSFILNFISWQNFICKKWKIIAVSCVLGMTLGIVYSVFSIPTYKAELNFVLEDDKSNGLGSSAGIASQLGISLGGANTGVFSRENMNELLKSRSMVEKTLMSVRTISGKSQTLLEYYIDFNKLKKSWKEDKSLESISFQPGLDRRSFTFLQDSIIGDVYNRIVPELFINKIEKKGSIVTVEIDSKNEKFAKYFADDLVKNVSDFYIETQTKKESENVAILKHQADSIRIRLNADITGVASSSDQNSNPNPSLQILRAPSQRRQVDVQVNTAILSELVKNLEISEISLRRETPLIQIIDRPTFPLERIKTGRLKGLVIGSVITGIISVICLTIQYLYKKIMQ